MVDAVNASTSPAPFYIHLPHQHKYKKYIYLVCILIFYLEGDGRVGSLR